MRSIKWKLVAIYLCLVFMIMIISCTFIILSLRQQEENKIKNGLVQYTKYIREQIVSDGEPVKFQDSFESLKNNTIYNFEGAILDSNGQTLASTAFIGGIMPKYNNQTVITALSGSSSFSASKWESDSTGALKEWTSYAEPVIENSDVSYVIFSRANAKSIRDSITKTTNTLIFSLIIAMAFTAIIGYIFANTLTEPIIMLTTKAKELAKGNLNIQISVRSNDEIGQLTESFNYMSKELNAKMYEISNEKNKLEIVLNNMTDGVLAFDSVGNLLHQNAASYDILDLLENEKNITFMEFIKKFDINSGVMLDTERDTTKEITIFSNNKYIHAGFAHYLNEKGVLAGSVVVLQDITEQKKLDEMRKDFVANVSHELRTPLATVKSYAETLIDGAVEDVEVVRDFLRIIDGETDRMTLLVTDLLQLSRFDNSQFDLNIVKINVLDFLSEIIFQNKIHAENKKQILFLDEIDKNDFIFADPDRLTQVINNILINSVKYCPEYATIRVAVASDKYFYKILIQDNGPGIPKNDLPRIFERFYRVDKARSRQMGGTGLGLSIAKEIMAAHKGKISVESVVNEGTVMTLHFSRL